MAVHPLSRDARRERSAFSTRWGALGVFGGRFLGPLRATVPLVAGMCAMPQLLFQLANFSSALLWAFVVLAPGAFGVEWMREVFD